MRTVTLKTGRTEAVGKGHPWVYADSVAAVSEPEDGPDDLARVVDEQGRVVGAGLYSRDSALRVRLVVRGGAPHDVEGALDAHLARAVALRRRLFPDPGRTDTYRLVHSEGDGMPGLVVDRLGPDVLVAQFGVAAMHARRARLGRKLLQATGCRTLVTRPAGFEESEGIDEQEVGVPFGPEPPERLVIREEGVRLVVAPLRGQKTGHYTDQRENRKRVGELARGLRVLDLHAGTGGFGLQCLAHGAQAVQAVESSPAAARAATEGGSLNGVAARLEVVEADVGEVLAAHRAARRTFELVVCDPPNFLPRRGRARGALKAHRELNVRAMSRVAPEGLLATFCCSASLRQEAFLSLLRDASRECRRPLRIVRELTAGPDHPVAAGLPEGRYLSGFLLQVDAEVHAGS